MPKKENPHPLHKYRTQAGLRLEDVGAKLGVNRSTIFRWETGEIRIPAERLPDLERVTGIPRYVLRPDLFLGGAA
jgi:transcriptional regulator with XRE-family HTH domain